MGILWKKRKSKSLNSKIDRNLSKKDHIEKRDNDTIYFILTYTYMDFSMLYSGEKEKMRDYAKQGGRI